MGRATIEVADIFRALGPRYREQHRLAVHQHQLMRAIEQCRTANLGGHVEQCSNCDHRRISYNSCRNRHCPKCQNLARAQWLERRKAELLPVGYFHVVFTIPDVLHDLALQNKKTVYNLLFQASAAALQSTAADPKHLGAELGFFSVLHTWGQNLMLHPHIHCVVTGGGLSLDRTRWAHPRGQRFLIHVKVLSRRFRTLFLAGLASAAAKGELQYLGAMESLSDPLAMARWLDALARIEWIVYAKPPFGGPKHVLEYLGRYTHRVAISNQRLLAFDGERVTFQYKDYRHDGPQHSKQMTLDGVEFIRRFLLHSLPPGFQRIRHYGMLASSRKRIALPAARKLLNAVTHPSAPTREQPACALAALLMSVKRCPACKAGIMAVVEVLPTRIPQRQKAFHDSS